MKSQLQDPKEHRHRQPSYPFMVKDEETDDVLLVTAMYNPTMKENAILLYSGDDESVIGIDRTVDLNNDIRWKILPPGYQLMLIQE